MQTNIRRNVVAINSFTIDDEELVMILNDLSPLLSGRTTNNFTPGSELMNQQQVRKDPEKLSRQFCTETKCTGHGRKRYLYYLLYKLI